MPYITQEKRKRIELPTFKVRTSGDLNYLFTQLIIQYVKEMGLHYSTINDIIGALEGAKLEFYRRIAAPYEDEKVKENGDVY